MRYFLISDNRDTADGMRLAGIEGVVVHQKEDVDEALDAVLMQEDVAIVLMTAPLVALCRDRVDELKLNRSRPLIVEIPDRHGNGRAADSIMRYVRDAIGIKI